MVHDPAIPPGPTRSRNPLVRLATLLRLVRDPLGFVGQRFEEHGDLYQVDEGGGRRLLVTRHPDAIRDVLVTHASSFQKAGGANDRLRPILGNGLLIADGEAWRRKRRLVQPAFRAKAIASYAETMTAHAEAVVWADGEVVEVSTAMMQLTLAIVCKALFDHDVRSDTDTVARAMESLREASQPDLWPAFVPTPRRLRARRAVADIDALISSLVATRSPDGGHTDLLAMLRAAGLEGRELRDELVTLFLAGHETTSHALTWTLALLGAHPEVREPLEAEIDEVLGGRPATLDDLPRLPTTDRVIAEAMRLYPPAYVVPRVAAAETEVAGFPVRPGDQVTSWIWHCHRDPRWFVDPEAFRPERFAEPLDVPHAYLPFGAGTRMCVGAGFAQMEMRLILASLVSRYRLVPTGSLPSPQPRVTLSPRGTMPMRVEQRR